MNRLTLLSALIILLSSIADAATKPKHLTSLDQVPEGMAKSDWQSIRAAYEAGRHAFHRVEGQEGVWQARNPGQQWRTTFDQRGFTTKADDGAWTWGLELETDIPVCTSAQEADKKVLSTLSFPRSAAITEWFVNDQRGLEQGWTLSAPAEIRLRIRGSLKASVSAQSISFGGQITYAGLKAWDATGKPVPTHFEATAEGFAVLYDDSAAQYPITIDPIAQQAYLKGSNTGGGFFGAGDFFGYSVAVSGDTAVIGAYGEASNATGVDGNQADNSASNAGAAYVFTRSGSTWTQQAYLKASNTGANDWFGYSVAVEGDTVVIGAPMESSNATGVGGNQADNSAGASGAAYVFTRSGGTWTQQAYLKASNTEAGDLFGDSVAVAGDTVVIGARYEASNATGVGGNQANNSTAESGAAYVFTRGGSTWTQQAYLKASNTGPSDQFGVSVAVSGDTVVIGALGEASNATGLGGNQADNSASYSGAAYVFTRSGSTWTQQAYLKASNTGADDQFGNSVAVSGDTVIIGASFEASNATGVGGNQANNSAQSSGAAYVFTRSGSAWTQQAYLKASNTGSLDGFGCSVAVSGDTAVVGALGESSNATGVGGNQADNSASYSGAAYVFTRSGSTWAQQAYLKASNTGAGDLFGCSVAVSGDTAVIGAYSEASSTTGVDGNQADNSAQNAGAAYTFNGLGSTGPSSAPTVTSLGVTTGSTAGGTSLTITGTGFSGATAVTFGGANATSFTVDSDTQITAISPAHAAGAVSVEVTTPVGTNPPNSLFTYILAPDIAVAQAVPVADGGSVAFGSALTGSCVAKTFTITNPGTADLTSLAITKDGANAAEFTVSSLSATSLATGSGTVTFTVTFSPTSVGSKTAAIHIASNVTGGKNPYDITLTGTAVAGFQNGSFEINGGSGSAIATGWTFSPTNSAVQVNQGTQGSYGVSFNFDNRTPNTVLSQSFGTVPGKTYSVSFDGGGGFGVTMGFSVNVVDGGSAGGTTQLIVPGSGAINAGPSGVTLSTNTTTIQIADTDDTHVNGVPAPNIRYAQVTFSFVAQSSVSTILFTDRSTATDGVDTFLDNVVVADAGTPGLDIAVAQAAPVADGGSVAFGSQTVSTSSSAKTFTITNPGSTDLTSLAITKDGTHASEFTVSSLSATSLATGSGTVTFTVIFSPTSAGSKTAAIHIASNVTGAKNPYDITLTGTAVAGFQNGSFEINGGDGSSVAAGWTFSPTNSAVQVNQGTQGSYGVSFNFDNRTPNTVLSQSFGTVPGKTYSVSFDGGGGFGVTMGFSVNVVDGGSTGGTTQLIESGSGSINAGPSGVTLTTNTTTIQIADTNDTHVNGVPAPNIRYAQVTFNFVAQSGVSTILFTDRSTATNGVDTFLDNVVVAEATSSGLDIAVAQAAPLADGGSVAFGSQAVSTSSSAKTFTITNPGTTDLTSLAITKDGTHAGEFTVSGLSATSLPTGSGTVTFTVTFSPTSAGAKTAAIHIASNVTGGKNPYDITLTGTAVAGFQNGSFETNGGSGSATATGWTFSPANSEVGVNQGTQGSYGVAFNSANRAANTVLSQSFGTIPGKTYSVSFDGGGGFGVTMGFSVNVVDGGSVSGTTQLIVPGSGSINAGPSGVTLTTNTTTIQIADTNDVYVFGTPAPNARFAQVTFSFVAQSSVSTILFTDRSTATDGLDTFLDNVVVAEAVADIAVAQASAVADGATVSFGNVVTGSNAPLTFTITNPGPSALTSLAITKDGDNSAEFTVSSLSATSLATGSGTVTFTVTFSPTSTGPKSAAIHIASNVIGAKNPYDITLAGTAVPPAPTVTAVSPSSGGLSGGTAVTITGTTFTGVTSVTFGGTAATNVVVSSPTTITATTPAHAEGAASVVVTTSGGSNAANTLYSYVVIAPLPINSQTGDVVSNGRAPDETGADSGADFDVIKRGGFLSENGTLVFPGNLLVGVGTPPVTLDDFQGLWKENGTGLKLIARTGTIAHGTTTATFGSLPNVPGISDNGDVTILGALTVGVGGTTLNDDTGLWTQVGSGTTPSTFKLLAREGSVIPGTSAVVKKFASGAYATTSLSATQGVVAYSVTTVGAPDKTAIYSTTMDNGVPISSSALAVEGDAAPGAPGLTFGPLASSYSDPARMDAAGNVAFAALLKPSNKESLWYAPFSTGVASKIFVAGDVAPDTGGATFLNLKSQAMGAAGIVTFRGVLTNNTGDNTGNLKNDGIWRGTGSNAASYTCILRRGDSNATRPGLNLPNAADKVGNLWHSWFTNANHGAWLGQFDAGGDGTSVPAPGDAYAIYTDLSGTMTLYLLYGDPAPGIAGATFNNIDLPIVGGQEQMVFIGKVTGGGVSAGINDQGIWRSAPNGGALSLLVRTGDTMTTTAGTKIIAKVDFPGSGSKTRQWEQPVMDSTGRVMIFVTFTDGGTSQIIAQ